MLLSWELQADIGSRHHNAVWAAWNMLITPFDYQCVLPFVFEQVGDTVDAAAHMFHQDLFTGCPWAMHSHQQHVVTCFAAVYCEAALLAYISLAQPQAFGYYLADISRT